MSSRGILSRMCSIGVICAALFSHATFADETATPTPIPPTTEVPTAYPPFPTWYPYPGPVTPSPTATPTPPATGTPTVTATSQPIRPRLRLPLILKQARPGAMPTRTPTLDASWPSQALPLLLKERR